MISASLPLSARHESSTSLVACDWQALRAQLILQWERITPKDLEDTGRSRQRIAELVERKYGIAAAMVENYLRNFERTLPGAQAA